MVRPEATHASETPSVGALCIEAHDLVLHRGRRRVLDVAELRLPVATVTSLVGPNGSGKSTLLHAVAGLLPVGAGALSVLGRPAGESHGRVAYVLQAQFVPHHLPVTVDEVVELARRRPPWRRRSRADRIAVDRAVDRLELGDIRRRRLSELSGGQRQRAFVAQGLAQEADLLLLDEPLAGLDLASAERIHQVVDDERSAGRSVVVATHDLGEAARSDRVVLLAGRLVAEGPPGHVLTTDHLRAAYGGRLLHLDDATLMLDDGSHHHGPDGGHGGGDDHAH